jgi:hypothetical protein
MTLRKVTLTLDPDLVKEAEKAVQDGRSRSISAWFNDVARRDVERKHSLAALMDEVLEETGGPITGEEATWARTVLGL